MDHDDHLVSCLVFLTHYFERPFSADVIRAGLALTHDDLSLSQFETAAAKAGLSAGIQKKPLEKILPGHLPSVLLLKEDRACVLVEKSGKETCCVHMPGEEDQIKSVPLDELRKRYTGRAVFVSKIIPPSRGLDGNERGDSIGPGWFLKAFSPHWWTYFQVVLAALMINLFALASPLFIMNVYDRVLPNNSIASLWVMAVGVIIVFGFDFLIKTLRSFFIDHAGKRVDMDLAQGLVDRVLDMEMAEKPKSSGEYANLIRELETLREFFTSATLLSIIDLPFILIFIFIFWLIAGPLALVLVITLVLIMILGLVFHFPLQRAVSGAFHDGHRKHSVLVEMTANLETIKSIRAEGWFRKLWKEAVSANAVTNTRSRLLSQFVVNSAALIQQLAYIGIVIYGVYLIQDNKITTGALIACVILNGRAMAPLAQVTLLLTRIHHAFSSFKGLNRLMQKPVERPENKRFLHRPDLVPDIEFKDVEFSYGDSGMAALTKVSFRIRPGEKIGLIGRSGSGKTTMGKLLIGLYPVTGGAIRLAGTDIRQIDPVDLRQMTGVVPQDVSLFQGTIRENILMAAPRTGDQQLLEASKIAGVDDFIRRHPMGYDLKVRERGEGLSGGQRQAIGVARSLVNDPKLLILDEPSSAMDNSSEEALKQRMIPYLEDRTLVLITHRISLLEMVDRLIVMDMGKVVADGPKLSVLKQLSQNEIRIDE